MTKQDREEFEAYVKSDSVLCELDLTHGVSQGIVYFKDDDVQPMWLGYQSALTRERARIAGMEEEIARAIAEAQAQPAMLECPGCNGKGYHHGFGEDGHDPDWCNTCGGSQVVPDPAHEARAVINAILQKGAGNEG